MLMTHYFLYGDNNDYLRFDESGVVDLPEKDINNPYPVAIGIDASTTKSGVTIGSIDQDFPFIFLEFSKTKGETTNQYLNNLLDKLVYDVILRNYLKVTHVFIEDKYIDKNKYSKKSSDALATVKVIMKDLPYMIESATGVKKPEYHLLQPQTWRKYYLGELNTNKGREYMKRLVAEFGIKKYNFHYNCGHLDDILDSVGIYSAGIKSVVKPNSKDNMIAEVIPNDIEWGHNLIKEVVFVDTSTNMLRDVIRNDFKIQERIGEYGFKLFEYYRGISLEKNLRSLTTNSNAVFISILDRHDMECVPLYYELREIPRENQSVVVYGYREKVKRGI